MELGKDEFSVIANTGRRMGFVSATLNSYSWLRFSLSTDVVICSCVDWKLSKFD